MRETDETGMRRTGENPLGRAALLADAPDQDVRRMQGVFGLPLGIAVLAILAWCVVAAWPGAEPMAAILLTIPILELWEWDETSALAFGAHIFGVEWKQ